MQFKVQLKVQGIRCPLLANVGICTHIPICIPTQFKIKQLVGRQNKRKEEAGRQASRQQKFIDLDLLAVIPALRRGRRISSRLATDTKQDSVSKQTLVPGDSGTSLSSEDSGGRHR